MMKNIDFTMSSPPDLRITQVVMKFIDSVLSFGLTLGSFNIIHKGF